MKKMLETKKLAFLQLLLSAVMMVFVVLHLIFANGLSIHIYRFRGANTELIIVNIFLITLGLLASVIGGFQTYVAFKVEGDRNYKVVGFLSGIPQMLSVVPYIHSFTTTLSFIINVLIYLDMIKPKGPKAESAPTTEETKEEKPETK